MIRHRRSLRSYRHPIVSPTQPVGSSAQHPPPCLLIPPTDHLRVGYRQCTISGLQPRFAVSDPLCQHSVMLEELPVWRFEAPD